MRVEALGREIDGRPVVGGLQLRARTIGAVTVMIGPSGCGKST